jgi:single-strand DNA-binding protein
MIAIVGEIQSRNYEDKNGNKRTAIEVNVNEVYFCGKEEEKETVYDGGQPTYIEIDNDDDVEDLPF